MALENQDTIYGDSLKNKTRKKQKKSRRKVKFYYTFMTFVLVFCVIQMGWSAFFNICKLVRYSDKLAKSKELKEQALVKNKQLKNEIENFNSMQKVESIARNNLKMAGENEVLVIINTPEEKTPPKTKKEEFIEFFKKNVADKLIHNNDPHGDFILQ